LSLFRHTALLSSPGSVTASSRTSFHSLPNKYESSFTPSLLLFPKSLSTFGGPFYGVCSFTGLPQRLVWRNKSCASQLSFSVNTADASSICSVTASSRTSFYSLPNKFESSFTPSLLLFPKSLSTFGGPFYGVRSLTSVVAFLVLIEKSCASTYPRT
jgi:hypothetical protein